MRRTITIFSFLLITAMKLFGTNIYVYNFNVFVIDNTDPSIKSLDEAGIDRISNLYQKAFTSISTDATTYRTLSNQQATQITGTVRTINSTIDALAVCFFYGVDFIIYGDVTIDPLQKQYSTHIKIYGKEQNSVIYELRYAKSIQVDKEASYVSEVAQIVNQQLPQTLQAMPPTAAQKKLAQLEEVENKKREEKQAEKNEEEEQKQKEDKLTTYMEKILDKLEQKETTEPDETVKSEKNVKSEKEGKKTAEISLADGQIITNKEKLFSFYIGVGYIFPFLGKWIDVTMPLVAIQAGPKFHFLLVDTQSFDFYLRPGGYVVYSFAMDKGEDSYNQYIRIDTLGAALGVEFCFEFGDFFGISIGGAVVYNFDYVIFRQYITEVYYSYASNALGAYGNVGLEFALGNEKNMVLGINNIINFKFYEEMYLDYRILLCMTFKV